MNKFLRNLPEWKRDLLSVIFAVAFALSLILGVKITRAAEIVMDMQGQTHVIAPERGKDCVASLGRPAPQDFTIAAIIHRLFDGEDTIEQHIEALAGKGINVDEAALRAWLLQSCNITDGKTVIPGRDA